MVEVTRNRPLTGLLARHRYLVLSAVVVLLMAVHTWNQQWSRDIWEHAAVVRELARHPLDPAHPILPVDAPHAFSTPYALLAALVVRAAGLAPVTVLAGLGLGNLALILWGLHRLAARLARPGAAFYLLLFTLVLWGPARPWRFSGFLHLNALGFVLPLASAFATGLALLVLAASVGLARRPRPVGVLLVGIGTGAVILTHPITGLFLAVGLGAVAVAAPSPARSLPALAGVGGLAALVALAWPYYPFWELALGEESAFHVLNRPMYERPVARTFPALLALPLLVGRVRRDPRHPVALTALGLAAVYAWGGLTGAWSYGRVVPGLVLMLHLTLADRAHAWELEYRSAGRALRRHLRLVGALGAALVVMGLVVALPGLVRAVPPPLLPEAIRTDPRLEADPQIYGFLPRHVGPDEVVLADLETAMRVPAFSGKVVAVLHPLAFVPDHPERRRDVLAFFRPGTTPEERLALLDRHRVSLLLLNDRELPSPLVEELAGLGTVLHRADGLTLVELP